MRDFSDKRGQVVTDCAQTAFSLLATYEVSKRGKVDFSPPFLENQKRGEAFLSDPLSDPK